MKQLKHILLWVVIVLVVAVVVNYALSYFIPGGPYLEGFASRSDAYPERSFGHEGFVTSYPTSVPMTDGKSAISSLYFMKNGTSLTDASLNAVMVDNSGVCPASATEMSKNCFNKLVGVYSLNTGVISAPVNVANTAALNIVSVLNKQLGLGYSTLSASAIQGAMSTQVDLSGVCQVAATGTITKECYNALINAFVINANKDGVVCSTSDVSGSATVPTSLTDDIKKTASSIGTSLSNAASTIKPTSDVSGAAPLEAKCTVQFGSDVVNPQTKAATTKAPDSTCTTTGDVAKTNKTPAVEQGCEFAQKFPKVNVINLRDYIHKDEVPCWSCKL